MFVSNIRLITQVETVFPQHKTRKQHTVRKHGTSILIIHNWKYELETKGPIVMVTMPIIRKKDPIIIGKGYEHHGVANHGQLLFVEQFVQVNYKENLKALCCCPFKGGIDGFSIQRASYAVIVSMFWRHHGIRVSKKAIKEKVKGRTDVSVENTPSSHDINLTKRWKNTKSAQKKWIQTCVSTQPHSVWNNPLIRLPIWRPTEVQLILRRHM